MGLSFGGRRRQNIFHTTPKKYSLATLAAKEYFGQRQTFYTTPSGLKKIILLLKVAKVFANESTLVEANLYIISS